MKKVVKGYILGFLTAAVLIGGTVYAAQKIRIEINGTELIPTDVTGKVIEPLIVDGSTYLPVRAIAQALGFEVKWEESTRTVKIDSSEEKEEIIEPEQKDENEKVEEKEAETEEEDDNAIEGVGQIILSNINKNQSKIRDAESGKVYTVKGAFMVGDWGSYRIVDEKLEYFKTIDHYGWESGTVEKSRYSMTDITTKYEIKLRDGTLLKAAPKVRINGERYNIDECTKAGFESIKRMIDGRAIWYMTDENGEVNKIETLD